MSQVDVFHQAWRSHFMPLILARTPVLDYERLPRFTFEEEPAGSVARRVLLSVLGLAVPALLIGWVAARRLARFPVVS